MSALNRQAKPSKPRDKNDFYPTKPEFAFAHCMLALQNLSPYQDEHIVFDLGVGSGVYGRQLYQIKNDEKLDFSIMGIDITLENLEEENRFYDFIHNDNFLSFTNKYGYDLIIGNPPYKNIIQFVKKAIELTKRGGTVSLLVKASFLETIERFEFFKEVARPNRIYFFANRPIKNHAESYCIVEFNNDYFDGFEKGSGGHTGCYWVYVKKDGYQII